MCVFKYIVRVNFCLYILDLSHRRPEFDLRSVYVSWCGQNDSGASFCQGFSYPLSVSFDEQLQCPVRLHLAVTKRTKFVTALESSAVSEVGELSIEKYFHVVF